MKPLDFTERFLAKAEAEGRTRRLLGLRRLDNGRVLHNGRTMVDFCSNDYLGLSFHPALKKAGVAAMESDGCGAGASRLMSGNLAVHEELEMAAARFKHKDCAMIAGAGYLVNIGIIPALAGRKDVVFSDRLNHASIVDGIRISGARMLRFRHNDMDHLRSMLMEKRGGFRRALIVAESVYSMDGDIAPVRELAGIAREHDAMLVIDEAHAVGVLGERGEGLVSGELADRVDCIAGTFGKALGGFGAFVAMNSGLRKYMLHRCRTFIFSTALPPAVAAVNLAGMKTAEKERGLRIKTLENAALFREKFTEITGRTPPGESQIIPVVIGKNSRAMALERHLRNNGILARAIRPPTVPEGTARIRFSVTAMHSREDIIHAVETTAEWVRNQ
jgi:8-amino-7-oxononanoate synthase